MVTHKRALDKAPKVKLIKSFVSSEELFSLYSARTGMNAWLNAPSAKSLLKTLGIFIMTTNASKATPAPNKPVNTMSLTRPRILETKVQKLTKPLLSNSLKDLKLFSDLEFSRQPHHLVLNQEKLN